VPTVRTPSASRTGDDGAEDSSAFVSPLSAAGLLEQDASNSSPADAAAIFAMVDVLERDGDKAFGNTLMVLL
jgi:hypothetical protein